MNKKWYGMILAVCMSVLFIGCAEENKAPERPRTAANAAQSTRPIVIPPATPTTEPEAIERPEPTATPKPTKEPEATETPKPTKKPEATKAPKPTKKPEAAETPKPTKEPEQEVTPEPTIVPEITNEPNPVATPTPTVEPAKKVSEVDIFTGKTVEAQEAEKGDVIFFGAYEQDGVEENGTERIAWQVVEKADNRLLLLSVYVLDAGAFHEEAAGVSWNNSSIKQWLQGEFYAVAFLPSEQSKIAVSTAGPVFLLSIEEVQRYFSVEKSELNLQELSDDRLAAKATDYAKAQGVWEADGRACWWLRSTGEFSETAVEITEDGSIYRLGTDVDFVYNGIRPALWLELQ